MNKERELRKKQSEIMMMAMKDEEPAIDSGISCLLIIIFIGSLILITFLF